MTPTTTLGVRLPNSGPLASPAAIRDVAVRADELGYDTVWVHDHVSWPKVMLSHYAAGSIEICQDQDPDFYESISSVAFLAGRLRRARVGVAGLVLPLRDPRVLGKQIATIERLSDSRLVLAAGIGNIPWDFTTMGVPYNRRGRIATDTLRALRAMFAERQPVDFTSKTVTFTEGTFLPRPVDLPIWVTASSEPGLARAAALGDGWMTVYVSPADYARMSARFGELTAEAGRDPATLTRAYETFVCVAETRAEAEQFSKASVEHLTHGKNRGPEVFLIGTPDDVAEGIAAYADGGAQHIELKFICRDVPHLLEQVDAIARRSVPTPAGAEARR
jgi:alkanesulfonate monooxygenase SsuD/methylene tetrahydromethanopterin reductase-like flavin-dependent oxidoreductase (luciferase family)